MKFLEKFHMNIPSWETLLNNINYSHIYKNLIKHRPLGFFVTHDAEQIDEVKEVLKKLNLSIAHIYMNLVIENNTFDRHNDDVDVYHWQVQGSSKWIFDDSSYILNPGDLIIVPKGEYHKVKPLSPRAGISMSN
jgi:mannose-6-phosphate isomerase-like protein (cupin superfamily)|tara:strand:- start:131 stop:532 length:402 start_codon:yes stop_codon:yes gene_type:complete